MTVKPGTSERLPCGCVIGTELINGERTLVYVPCRLDCRYYLFTIEESRKQGNRITRIDAR